MIAGLNFTRVGEHLARDIVHTDLQMVITEPRHEAQLDAALDGVGPARGRARLGRFVDDDDPLGRGRLARRRAGVGLRRVPRPGRATAGDVDDLWVLLFTSGTSAAPKAVRCTQRRLLTTGNRMAMMLELTPADVGYSAMPLFHTNSLMSGLAPALVAGASLSLARRFSASGFLPDVRRYGATWFNYTGKAADVPAGDATRADDADNTLRVGFGNEGSPRWSRRPRPASGCGSSTCSGRRKAPSRSTAPATAPHLHRAIAPGDHGRRRGRPRSAAGRVRRDGRLLNADRCVGEIVNTLGVGPFEGYYRNDEAMRRTTRDGWYWSGDLAYVDEEGWVFFAGRTADWLRVDGESFPAAPIEAIVGRHPDVLLASVYAVPDPDAGDQVMAALVLREGVRSTARRSRPGWTARPISARNGGLGSSALCGALPTTPTNKVLTRTLVHEKFRL